jgi:predicted amidophosphoribosyltransferase
MTEELEHCTCCGKDTTYINRNEDRLCDECAADPDVIACIEEEKILFESFRRYYQNYELSETL